jgi:peptide/nickel transport system permease protein
VLPYLLSYVVMAFVLQVSGAILAEATLSLLGLGPANSVSLGIMLYWALAWGSVRQGAWWAFLPPTIMLSIVAFALLLLQSSLDEVFNPRLRRGKSARRKKISAAPAPARLSETSPQSGGAPVLQTPVSASTGNKR